MTNAPRDPNPSSEDETIVGKSVEPFARPTPTAIGPYHIIGHLGEGGMGTVFEAEQVNPRRRVALKVMRGGSFVDEDRVRMFQREIESLARLKHPNIGAIYDAGRTDAGEHFFAMELVRGATLDEFLAARSGPPSRDEIRFRLRLFQSICEAVHYAHQRSVIHRDLKPSNIVVATGEDAAPDGMPTVKILDFGLARITEADVAATAVTELGVIKGTLAYMSPEQTRGNPGDIDLRTDVYSLGVILYEMLTGAFPYNARTGSLMEIVRTICDVSPVPLRTAWPAGWRPDRDLETIVGKSLEKEAALRYSSAAALSEDVDRYLDSRPINARAPSSMYQLRKFARRNRALVGGVVATFVVLVAGVIASTTFGLRASAQRRAAEEARRSTEAVVDFQRRMLSEINASQMGQDLAASLRERLEGALREQGETEHAIARAIASFNAGLERINATDVALGVVDQSVLRRALDTADERFGGSPMIRAQLKQSIGETYFTLGLLDRAEPTLLSAIALYDSLLGKNSKASMDAKVPLALVYTFQGRADVAEPLYHEIIAYRTHALGAEDSLTMLVKNDLGILYMDAGRSAEAESLFTSTLAVLRERYGEEDKATLTTMVNYAWLLTQDGRYAEAESLGVKALAGRRKVLGEHHPETMQSVNNLAVIYNRTGRPQLAEPLILEDYEVSRETLGEEHPDILPTMSNLGKVYIAQGKYEQAVQILEKAVITSRKVMPPGFFGTGITLQSYGEALAGLGRDREAERALVEAYGILEPVRGADHPGVSHCADMLATIYARTGRPTEAALWRSRVKAES